MNNPTTYHVALEEQTVRYAIWQAEAGENNTVHLQGYIEFHLPQRRTAVSKILPRAHLEPRKGTREQARDYCRKEDTRIDGPWEFGTFGTQQGRRTDLVELQAAIKRDAPTCDLWENHFDVMLKYHKSVHEYKQSRRCIRTAAPKCIVYWGDTGSGKSYTARTVTGEGAYWKNASKWWNGYDSQQAVVWDDFEPRDVPYETLLKVIDENPYQVESKGATTWLAFKLIIFTSNIHPGDWYNRPTGWEELKRRITRIVHFSGRHERSGVPQETESTAYDPQLDVLGGGERDGSPLRPGRVSPPTPVQLQEAEEVSPDPQNLTYTFSPEPQPTSPSFVGWEL